MSIYKCESSVFKKYKNIYKQNVCGANCLEVLGFPKKILKKALRFKDKDLLWKTMLKYIKEYDNCINKKNWLNKTQPTQTRLQIIEYPSEDTTANQYYIQYICNECKPNTYKIIGIAGDNHGENWGHYMLIGKNEKGEVVSFDPQRSTYIEGIPNIIQDFREDHVEHIIHYCDGLYIDNRKKNTVKKTQHDK